MSNITIWKCPSIQSEIYSNIFIPILLHLPSMKWLQQWRVNKLGSGEFHWCKLDLLTAIDWNTGKLDWFVMNWNKMKQKPEVPWHEITSTFWIILNNEIEIDIFSFLIILIDHALPSHHIAIYHFSANAIKSSDNTYHIKPKENYMVIFGGTLCNILLIKMFL